MASAGNRWTLPDREGAVEWCRMRNEQGIRCIIDILVGYGRNPDQVRQAADAYLETAKVIHRYGLDASISVKLTTLGAVLDRAFCQRTALLILREAADLSVGFEIDIESRGLVGFTLDTARICAAEGDPVTLALQAYLDRTPADLAEVVVHEIRPRLVKGAYAGDTDSFEEIQQRFRELVDLLLASGSSFSIGTHDPELLEWAQDRCAEEKGRVEFSFLLGFADQTKMKMARSGWNVAEYVPVGMHSRPYEARRMKYLRELDRLGRRPAP
jgi:proline dehydrogenase